MAQISILQIIGLFLFLIIGLCLYALQNEKYDQYRWHIFGTCIACFIGTGIIGYLAFVPTPYTPPDIINDSYGDGKKKGGAAGKSSGKKGGGGGSGKGGSGNGGEGGEGGEGGDAGDDGGKGVNDNEQPPGTRFSDCNDCPEMIVIPKGRNRIGTSNAKTDFPDNEKPQADVQIFENFAVSVGEISTQQFQAFADETGFTPTSHCNTDGVGGPKANFLSPAMEQGTKHPVVCVSFHDAQKYTAWLTQKTGNAYRLLSEAEWEYTRRGAKSPTEPKGLIEGAPESGNIRGDLWIAKTTGVGANYPNAFKVHDMMGNAAEWTLDCWHPDNKNVSSTGAARTASGDCSFRSVRGGSWDDRAVNVRPASRRKVSATLRDWRIGFRVMRPMTLSADKESGNPSNQE